MAPHKGKYYDCIHEKGNTLLLLISEVFGGVNGRALRYLTRLAHAARSNSDAVHLDRAGRIVSFFSHYAAALSSAAAVGHARVIQHHAADVRVQAARVRAESSALAVAAAAVVGATLSPVSPMS